MESVAAPVKLYSSFGLRYSWYVALNCKRIIRKEGLGAFLPDAQAFLDCDFDGPPNFDLFRRIGERISCSSREVLYTSDPQITWG